MIRLCEHKDESVWEQLNIEFMRYEYQDGNVWQNPQDKGDPSEIFSLIMREPNSPNRLYVIEEGGQTVGFMNTSWFFSVWAHGKVLLLDDLYIRKDRQGQGIGSKALSELENLLKKEGFERIQLLAEDTNPGAVRFYKRENYSSQKLTFFCKYLQED